MNQSETPRTDAALKEVLQCGYDYKVKADFARKLEIELHWMVESRKVLIEANERLRNELRAKSL